MMLVYILRVESPFGDYDLRGSSIQTDTISELILQLWGNELAATRALGFLQSSSFGATL